MKKWIKKHLEDIPKHVLGLHWYGTEKSQEYNNIIDANNYKTFGCTLTNIAMELGL